MSFLYCQTSNKYIFYSKRLFTHAHTRLSLHNFVEITVFTIQRKIITNIYSFVYIALSLVRGVDSHCATHKNNINFFPSFHAGELAQR